MRSAICIVTALAGLGLLNGSLFGIAARNSRSVNAELAHGRGTQGRFAQSRQASDWPRMRIKGPAPRSSFEKLQDPTIFPLLSSAGQRAMLMRSGMSAQPMPPAPDLIPQDSPAPVLDQ